MPHLYSHSNTSVKKILLGSENSCMMVINIGYKIKIHFSVIHDVSLHPAITLSVTVLFSLGTDNYEICK
jgi:hypothetical protein